MTNNSENTPRVIDSDHARLVVDSGGVVAATLKNENGAWVLQLQTGKGGFLTLGKAKEKNQVRTWADLARAAAYARERLKIGTVKLEMENWQPKQRAI